MGDISNMSFLERVLKTEAGMEYLHKFYEDLVDKKIEAISIIVDPSGFMISMSIEGLDGPFIVNHPDLTIESLRDADDPLLDKIREQELELYFQEYPERRPKE